MAYPPSVPAATRADNTTTTTTHAGDHNTDRAALIDVVAELGANPSGASSDVTARLTALDATVAAESSARTTADSNEATARAAADTAEATARANADASKAAIDGSNVVAATWQTALALGTAATANKVAAGSAGVLDATDATTTNTRTPSTGSVVDASVSAGAAIAESKLALASDAAAATASRRTLGTGATQALPGNHVSTTNARTPTAHAASHAPAGTDDLTTALSATAVPVALADAAAMGAGTGFSRQGHVHPNTGVQKTSEKDQPSGYPGLSAGGFVVPAQLGSGTRDGTKFLRDDGTWQVVSGGGGAPTDATYVTLTANGTLSAEAVLGSAVNMRGTLAARPAAGTGGRLYDTTDDDQEVKRDTSTSWDTFAIKGVTIKDEGVSQGAGVKTLDFVGTGLSASVAGTTGTITFTAGGTTGMELLGSATLTGADANTMTAITIAARDHLQVVVLLAGYDSADAPALRFNADSGANYSDRHISAATGAATLTNSENLSATSIRLGNTNSTQARMIVVNIGNLGLFKKVATIVPALGASSAAAASVVALVGTGVWHNATDQITSVQLRSVGANLIKVGTKVLIYGRNA